jgi:hypothetical protein
VLGSLKVPHHFGLYGAQAEKYRKFGTASTLSRIHFSFRIILTNSTIIS